MNQDDINHDIPEDDSELVSKTRMKKDMLALQELAVQLLDMNPEQRAQLPLTEDLIRAIEETKNIKKREALRRHHQFLGRLMRSADHEAIRAAMDQFKEKQDRLVRLLHVMERWRDELIDDQDNALERFFNEFPHADRQEIRNLVRGAQQERRQKKAPANARKLFRYIRDVIANIDDNEA